MERLAPDEEALHRLIRDDSLLSSLNRIREASASLWAVDAPRLVRDFTDHGPNHSARIAGLLRRVLAANKGQALTEQELYVLLCGVYLHDVGMQCDPVQHPGVAAGAVELGADQALASPDFQPGAPSHEEQKLIRANHQYLSAAWVSWARRSDQGVLREAAQSIPPDLVRDIMDVCLFHTKLDILTCPESFKHHPTLRKRFVAALLRFCDELDIDSSRVSSPTVIHEFSIDPGNEVYWWLHNVTHVDFLADNIVRITTILHPHDNERFGDKVRQEFLDRFRQKNEGCLAALQQQNLPMVIDPASDVKPDPEVPRFPESIARVLEAIVEPATSREVGAQPTQAGGQVAALDPVLRRRLLTHLNAAHTPEDLEAV